MPNTTAMQFDKDDDDLIWDESFSKTQTRLEEVAKLAKKQILDGKSKELDICDL